MLQIQKQKELVDVGNAANEYTEAMNQKLCMTLTMVL